MEIPVKNPGGDVNKTQDVASGLGSAERMEEKVLKSGSGVYSVLPIQQPSSDPTLTCSGLDTGIQIEDFISNEAEDASQDASTETQDISTSKSDVAQVMAATTPDVGTSQSDVTQVIPALATTATEIIPTQAEVIVVSSAEVVVVSAATEEDSVDVPMGKNSIEIEVTTTAGENEAVVGPLPSDKLPRSCVVNMASLDEDKDKASKKNSKAGKPPNGAVRGRKTGDKPPADPSKPPPAKRGRKPGSKNAKAGATTDKNGATGGVGDSSLTRQPFSDGQQQQLRAQILVYGAIIQKAFFDEALMGAAFMDVTQVHSVEGFENHFAATRHLWEKTYKATMERIAKEKPTMVTSPVAPQFKAPSSLPPKPASKTKPAAPATKNPNSTSEFPVSPLGTCARDLASATVSSWNARPRTPDGGWQLHGHNIATPPRFASFQQGGPWRNPPPVAYFGTFPQSSPPGGTTLPQSSPFPPVVGASGQAEAGDKTTEPKKRRRSGDDSGTAGSVPVFEVPEDSPTAPEKTPTEEYVRQVQLARQTAEEAASASATLVEQSQRVWEELKAKMKNNPLTQKEAKFASYMAAATAGSSVAKAACAAANVAFAAVLQVKAMAMDAIDANEDTGATPAHDKGANVIATAKKAASDQAKSGLAIAQEADNISAIIRAAELASAAACQAGELMFTDPTRVGKAKGKRTASRIGKPGPEKKIRTEENKDVATTEAEATPEADTSKKPDVEQPENANEADPSDGMVDNNRLHQKPAEIVEGSHIEIVPDEDGLQGVWFAGKVIQIKDDDAYVKYDDLLADDGETPLEEWVDLRGHLNNVPRVRIAHPVTTEAANRRRRRAAMGNQTWVQGDRVDVWMRDGWWEGIVQSVVEEDHTVTVFFPADGDTENTKSWNLRPSLLWHNGAWILWRDIPDSQKPSFIVQKASSPATSDDSRENSDNETGPRSRKTKRRKFSEVMGKDDEKMKALQSQKSPATGVKQKKSGPSPTNVLRRTPTSARKSAEKKKSTSSDVTTDDAGEIRKSSRLHQQKAKKV